jgi:polysaccharide biosynthesis transport protein
MQRVGLITAARARGGTIVEMLASEAPALVEDELDIRAWLTVLRRRWRAIVAVALVAVAAAVALSLRQDEKYRAEADLLIRQLSTETLFTEDNGRTSVDPERQLNNEVRFLESGAIRGAVDDAYEGPLNPSDVDSTVSSDTSDVVTVSVIATDPNEAADLVNTYVNTFIEERRQQRVDELLAAGSEIQTQVDELSAEIAEVRTPLDVAEAALREDPTDEALIARRDAAAAQVSGRIAGLQSRQSFYLAQLEDLEVTAQIAGLGGAQVLTPAEVPDVPVSPKPVRDAVVALLLGVLLGVATAFLLENLDERIRSVADLERVAAGRPTLAMIPEGERRAANLAFVAARDEPGSVQAEAFRSLRTAVKFAAIETPIQVVQVTSAVAGEGKTTTVANLALALAQGGDRVAAVDCDLRRPTLHERFGLPPTPGFTDVLVGDVALSAALRRYDDSLMVLPAGSHAPNPSELLSSSRAASVIAALAEEFDIVVMDTTPVLPVTDSLVVSRVADAVLVVADAQSTRRNSLRRTLQLLDQVSAPTLGVVLNGVTGDSAYGYAYGYGYGYSAPPGRDRDPVNGRKPRGAKEPTPTG